MSDPESEYPMSVVSDLDVTIDGTIVHMSVKTYTEMTHSILDAHHEVRLLEMQLAKKEEIWKRVLGELSNGT